MSTAMLTAVSPRIDERLARGQLSANQVEGFRQFLEDVDRELLHHRIITDNAYTRWFEKGEASDSELKHFIKQFSVFSNQFLIASLLKVINAPTLQQARSTKEILLNELGVIYRRREPASRNGHAHAQAHDSEGHAHDGDSAQAAAPVGSDREGDPELVSTEGTVDGGVFRFRAAHFEWLLAIGETVGLGFDDMGKRRNGTAATLEFCDALHRLYGAEDPQIAEGASFAVENWAAAGFWQELEDGLVLIKNGRLPKLRLAFFTWHNRVEAQHAGHTMEELEDVYFSSDFDRDRFFRGASDVLDAIAGFWDGLERDRLNRRY